MFIMRKDSDTCPWASLGEGLAARRGNCRLSPEELKLSSERGGKKGILFSHLLVLFSASRAELSSSVLPQVGLLHCPRSYKSLAALFCGESALHEECPMNIESLKSEESRQNGR